MIEHEPTREEQRQALQTAARYAERHDPSSEYGWLIELGSDPPSWWDGRAPDGFVWDAFEAVRFARAEDAQRIIVWSIPDGVRRGCKATLHGFDATAKETGDQRASMAIYEGQAEALREQDAEIKRLCAREKEKP